MIFPLSTFGGEGVSLRYGGPMVKQKPASVMREVDRSNWLCVFQNVSFKRHVQLLDVYVDNFSGGNLSFSRAHLDGFI